LRATLMHSFMPPRMRKEPQADSYALNFGEGLFSEVVCS
jgi:hypothetical protein